MTNHADHPPAGSLPALTPEGEKAYEYLREVSGYANLGDLTDPLYVAAKGLRCEIRALHAVLLEARDCLMWFVDHEENPDNVTAVKAAEIIERLRTTEGSD